MNVNVTHKQLLAALDALTALAKECVPALPPVAHIVADDDGARISLTTVEAHLILDLPGEVKDEGETWIDVKALMKATKMAEGDTLRLETVEDNLVLVEMDTRIRIEVEEPLDLSFLSVPPRCTVPTTAVEAPILLGMVEFCEKSISKDLYRDNITGVNFRSEGTFLRVASTDGHRLHRRRAPLQNNTEESFDFLLPSWGVPVLKKVLKGREEKVAIAGRDGDEGRKEKMFQGEGFLFVLFSFTNPTMFPDISSFENVGGENVRGAVFDRTAVIKQLKKITKNTGKKTILKWHFHESGIRIEASNGKTSVDTMLKVLVGDFEHCEFNTDLEYTLDALEALESKEVSITPPLTNGPVYFYPQGQDHDVGALCVVMPLN